MHFFKTINQYIPKFIRRNFGRKVIALFFALLVYLKVSNQLGEESIINNVPVNIVPHGEVEVLGYGPGKVSVTLKGSKNKIRLLSPSDINIEIPVNNSVFTKRGFSTHKPIVFEINKSDITLPGTFSIIKVVPDQISVHVDKKETRQVKVVPSYKGDLPQDFAKGRIKVIPDTVSVTGPASTVRQIKFLLTKPIALDRTTVASFQVDKRLQEADKDILVSPRSVQVNVEVYKKMATKIYGSIPISVMSGENKLNVKLFQNDANITLWGLKSHLEILERKKIKPFIDISKFTKPGIYDAKVNCWVMDPVLKVKFIEPSLLKVEIMK